MGRPKKEINQRQFESLCGLQCTQQEICDFFNLTDKTLTNWCKKTYGESFSEVFRQKRGNGKISLRRSQWQAAEKGNASLLIWLGKQYLSQSETPAKEAEKEDSQPFDIPAKLMAAPYFDMHRDICDKEHMEYVAYGGRGSAKSSFVSLEIVHLIKNNPDIHAVCARKVANTLRDSVFSQIIWAIDALGLSAQFESKVNPMEITYTPTGQKIYFRGADDPIKLKSIKPRFGYIGILWLEELDQFHGDEECRNIQQSVIRGGDEAYIFKSFNPPKSANNWANVYVAGTKDNRYELHTDYTQVPKKWLGKAFLDEAEYLKGINPTAYEHEYLGIANGNGGAVFENVKAETITTEQIAGFDKIYNGVDWGYFPDPWAFDRCYYDSARRTLYIFGELEANKKGNRETADMLLEYGLTREDKITADAAEPKSIADYNKYGLKCLAAKKGAGSVDYSMKWLQSLNAIVIDPDKCPKTYKEFINYEYERTKDGEIVSGYPDKDNHHIDAVRYAMEVVWKKPGDGNNQDYKPWLI
jgi:PBSX family phage terminase large subunit